MLLVNLTYWSRTNPEAWDIFHYGPNRYGRKEAGRVTTVKRDPREPASMRDQDNFLRTAPEICETQLGSIQQAKATLHLKENVRAVFKPKRPVPYASMGRWERNSTD